MKNKLLSIYRKLYSTFGSQGWWPASTPFEVTVGAILTQNTSWSNVEKAIDNLKSRKLLRAKVLYRLPEKSLARIIKPAGYYNVKAKRLRNFLKFFIQRYHASIRRMASVKAMVLRNQLLAINGIGPETADSIILYALHKPVFVIDAYTKRILLRHGLIKDSACYEDIQRLFMHNLKRSGEMFNEYHALLVKLGKDFCLKHKPKCHCCPLKKI